MYKLVAIDLDGTMLNSYGIVTEHTKNIIQNNISILWKCTSCPNIIWITQTIKKMIYSTLTEIIIPYIYDKCVIFCNNCLGLLYLPLDMKQTNFVPESKYIRIHNNPNITIESNPTFTAIISLNFIIIAPIIMGVIIAIAARLNPHFVSVIQ